MEFKVKGMTFKNEEAKDIQSLIKKELRELQDNLLFIFNNEKHFYKTSILYSKLKIEETFGRTNNVTATDTLFDGE